MHDRIIYFTCKRIIFLYQNKRKFLQDPIRKDFPFNPNLFFWSEKMYFSLTVLKLQYFYFTCKRNIYFTFKRKNFLYQNKRKFLLDLIQKDFNSNSFFWSEKIYLAKNVFLSQFFGYNRSSNQISHWHRTHWHRKRSCRQRLKCRDHQCRVYSECIYIYIVNCNIQWTTCIYI